MPRYPATTGPFLQCGLWLTLLLLTGCNLGIRSSGGLPVADVPVPTPAGPQANANEVMAGICFEAAHDAAGRPFVLRNAAELATFFDLADHSQLCRRPVTRHTFDFSEGRVLAGLWSAGHGCRARHEVTGWTRDDDARHIRLQLRLVSIGDCNYELVRPYWLALDDAREYEVDIEALP